MADQARVPKGAKEEYIRGTMTLAQLAERYGVKAWLLCRESALEGWRDARKAWRMENCSTQDGFSCKTEKKSTTEAEKDAGIEKIHSTTEFEAGSGAEECSTQAQICGDNPVECSTIGDEFDEEKDISSTREEELLGGEGNYSIDIGKSCEMSAESSTAVVEGVEGNAAAGSLPCVRGGGSPEARRRDCLSSLGGTAEAIPQSPRSGAPFKGNRAKREGRWPGPYTRGPLGAEGAPEDAREEMDYSTEAVFTERHEDDHSTESDNLRGIPLECSTNEDLEERRRQRLCAVAEGILWKIGRFVAAEDIFAEKNMLRQLTAALKDIRDVFEADADAREQEAKIAKLRREAAFDQTERYALTIGEGAEEFSL